MREILDLVDPLEDTLDALRSGGGMFTRKPYTDDMRAIRKRIETLMAEYWLISAELNADWHNQAPLWKKKFSDTWLPLTTKENRRLL